jgi:hypothetical protein
MTLKHLVKILQNLDQDAEIKNFEIRIDNTYLSIRDVEKEPVGTETAIFKRAPSSK